MKAKIRDIYSRLSGLCLCSLPLAGIFYGSSDKGDFVATPSAPCPELALLECANCCQTKGRLCPSLPHGWALILHGVGIKTASVSSGRSALRAAHSLGLLHSREALARLWDAGNDRFPLPNSPRGKHLPPATRVPFVHLGTCRWDSVWGTT